MKKIIFLIVGLILILGTTIYFNTSLRDEDRVFVANVKNALKDKSLLKVSDFNNSDWEYVCAISGDSIGGSVVYVIAGGLDRDRGEFTLKEGNPEFLKDHNGIIAFVDKDFKITSYEYQRKKIVFFSDLKKACYKREAAFFKVLETSSAYSDEVRKQIGMPDDYLKIIIIDKE